MSKDQGHSRVVNLVTGEKIVAEVIAVNDQEVLLKTPFIIKDGMAIPYLSDEVGESPGAIQVHMMQIVWATPLSDFPTLHALYLEKTTGIQIDMKKSIII